VGPTAGLGVSEKIKIFFCCSKVIFQLNIIMCNMYNMYRVILSVLDPRKCEYLKEYSLDFEHAYMTTYLAS
jgi:hypothetical protein